MMTPDSTSDSSSIFKNGKLKPGIYNIQNLYGQTYMDIHEHSRDVCCRSAMALGEGRGLVHPLNQLVTMYLTIRSGKSCLLGLGIPCGG